MALWPTAAIMHCPLTGNLQQDVQNNLKWGELTLPPEGLDDAAREIQLTRNICVY